MTRIAFVTGASRGVGKGIAVELGAAGFRVYCTGRSDAHPTYSQLGGTVHATAAAVTEAGGAGIAVVADHRDDAQTTAALATVHEPIDLLVNNVWGGYSAYHEERYTELEGDFWDQPLHVWDDMFAAGVRAHYVTTALAVPRMAPGGLIVTISFFRSPRHAVAYNVAKVADDAFTAHIAPQVARRGLTAVALYPGLVRTEAVLRSGDYFDLSNAESPRFTGRAVLALADDPARDRHNGRALVVAELAAEYGFADIDGSRPTSVRAEFDGA
jgi:dehydrogenase/reductase SDR family protein 1